MSFENKKNIDETLKDFKKKNHNLTNDENGLIKAIIIVLGINYGYALIHYFIEGFNNDTFWWLVLWPIGAGLIWLVRLINDTYPHLFAERVYVVNDNENKSSRSTSPSTNEVNRINEYKEINENLKVKNEKMELEIQNKDELIIQLKEEIKNQKEFISELLKKI